SGRAAFSGSPDGVSLPGEPDRATLLGEPDSGELPAVQSVDLDEDTIVPHSKDEDLPIFAGLESEWFLRREDEPLPPPPGLPWKEWGFSWDDLPPVPAATADSGLPPVAAGSGLETETSRPAAAATAATTAPPSDGTGAAVPLLPLRRHAAGGGHPGRP